MRHYNVIKQSRMLPCYYLAPAVASEVSFLVFCVCLFVCLFAMLLYLLQLQHCVKTVIAIVMEQTWAMGLRSRQVAAPCNGARTRFAVTGSTCELLPWVVKSTRLTTIRCPLSASTVHGRDLSPHLLPSVADRCRVLPKSMMCCGLLDTDTVQ